MFGRVSTALDKLRFCLQVADDTASGVRLLTNTKRFSGAGRTQPPVAEAPESYRLRLGGQPQHLHLRTYTGDLAVFYEVFWRHVYDLPALRSADIRTVVDVGANVGMAALDFLLRFPEARVICLEPERANVDLLTQNLSPYLASGRAVVERAALASADTQVSIQNPGYAYNAQVSEQAGADMVPAYSLATVMHRHHLSRIDLLKIDVEDYEKVIFGARTEWLAQVQNLVIEIHSPGSHAVVMRALTEYGLQVQRLSGTTATEGIFWAQQK